MSTFSLVYIIGRPGTGKTIIADGLKRSLAALGCDPVSIEDCDLIPTKLAIDKMKRKGHDCIIVTTQTPQWLNKLPTPTKIINVD